MIYFTHTTVTTAWAVTAGAVVTTVYFWSVLYDL